MAHQGGDVATEALDFLLQRAATGRTRHVRAARSGRHVTDHERGPVPHDGLRQKPAGSVEGGERRSWASAHATESAVHGTWPAEAASDHARHHAHPAESAEHPHARPVPEELIPLDGELASELAHEPGDAELLKRRCPRRGHGDRVRAGLNPGADLHPASVVHVQAPLCHGRPGGIHVGHAPQDPGDRGPGSGRRPHRVHVTAAHAKREQRRHHHERDASRQESRARHALIQVPPEKNGTHAVQNCRQDKQSRGEMSTVHDVSLSGAFAPGLLIVEDRNPSEKHSQ